jgi:hypothetical protein
MSCKVGPTKPHSTGTGHREQAAGSELPESDRHETRPIGQLRPLPKSRIRTNRKINAKKRNEKNHEKHKLHEKKFCAAKQNTFLSEFSCIWRIFKDVSARASVSWIVVQSIRFIFTLSILHTTEKSAPTSLPFSQSSSVRCHSAALTPRLGPDPMPF